MIAETRNIARDAAEKVTVDYDELPAVVDPARAQDEGAPQVHAEAPRNTIFSWELGEAASTDAALARAAHIVELDVVNSRLVPNAMEPRAAVGVYDPAEEHYTLYNTSQNPHVARLVLSAFVGIAPSTSFGSWRRTSAAASAPRSSSIRKRPPACGRRNGSAVVR